MREALEHALALIEGPNGQAIRSDPSWAMYREGIKSALENNPVALADANSNPTHPQKEIG